MKSLVSGENLEKWEAVEEGLELEGAEREVEADAWWKVRAPAPAAESIDTGVAGTVPAKREDRGDQREERGGEGVRLGVGRCVRGVRGPGEGERECERDRD
jgi:hypothetical protein